MKLKLKLVQMLASYAHPQPLAQVSSLAASGNLIVAHQATWPAVKVKHMFHVGAWHQAPVYATKPGCRPQPKIYTEVEAVLVDTGACFGVGLEPTLNMVGDRLYV